jgi:hypothetical protein
MLTTDLCAQCGSPAAIAALAGSPCRCVLRHAAVATAPGRRVTDVAPTQSSSDVDPALAPPPPPPVADELLLIAFARGPDAEALPPAVPDVPAPEPASAVETGRGWSVRAGRDAPRLDWDVLQPPDPPRQDGDPAWSIAAAAHLAPVKPTRRFALRAGVIASAALLVAVAAVDGVAGGGLGRLFGSGRSLSQPSAIGSMALVDTPDAQVTTDAVRAGLGAGAKETVVGVYGSTGAPQLIFVAAKGGTPESSQQIVGDLTNAGLGFNGSGTIIPALDGQQFECGVLSGQAFGTSTLCAWNENDIDAVVLNLGSSDLQATATLAAQARAAAVH